MGDSVFADLGVFCRLVYRMVQLPWGENFSNAAYFSFVTLTTLGYGDISPTSPVAQVIVYLEAIAGVFYMAIVVASLVGASQTNQEKNDG